METYLITAIAALTGVVAFLFGALSTVVGIIWKVQRERLKSLQAMLDECERDRKELHEKNDRTE